MGAPEVCGRVLVEHCLDCLRFDTVRHSERPFAPEKWEPLQDLITRRNRGEPLAYLTGCTEFMSLSFAVDNRVMVPRPETEVLVERALEIISTKSQRPLDVADIGTGCGAIVASLAHYASEIRAIATDISGEALDVARQNAVRYDVVERIHFLQGPGLKPLTGRTFDLVVSNPPYISDADMEGLPVSVRDYEPLIALRGGPHGLNVINTLVSETPSVLRNGGVLLTEIGYGQWPAVRGLAEAQGTWSDISVHKDLAGIDRIIELNRR